MICAGLCGEGKGRSQWRSFSAALFIALALSVFGCATPKTFTHPVSPIIRFILPEKTRVPGRFLVAVDDPLRNLHADVRPPDSECSSHHFPVRVGYAFVHVLMNAMRFQFDEVIVIKEAPPVNNLGAMDVDGGIFIQLESFTPSVTCPIAGPCRERTDVALRVRVFDGNGGPLMNEVIQGMHTTQGGSITSCRKIAPHLNDSVSEALQNVAAQLMERIGEVTAHLKPR